MGGRFRGRFHRNQEKGYFMEGVVNDIDAIKGSHEARYRVVVSPCQAANGGR